MASKPGGYQPRKPKPPELTPEEKKALKEKQDTAARRKREIIAPIVQFASVLEVPLDEFEHSIVPFIESFIDDRDEGLIKGPQDIFDPDLLSSMDKHMTDDGVTMGYPIPDEEDFPADAEGFEKAWDEWRNLYDEKLNRLMGVIAFVVFQDKFIRP